MRKSPSHRSKSKIRADWARYPTEVVITDEIAGTPGDGTSTPAGEPVDDFFSSWDKPTIKRPSNPPSRTGTPPVVSRTASPFLSAGQNGANRPKSPSPLAGAAAEAEKALPAPTAIRTTSASAIRKGPALGGPKKSVLGAKKTTKLGAKKLGGDDIDFEAAEKAAKAEAERIAKLGYDPEDEEKPKPSVSKETPLIAPTPISPSQAANKNQHQRSPSEVERLGMGMGRLGFGQVGKPASTAPAPKKLGFGAIGAAKPAAAGAAAAAAAEGKEAYGCTAHMLTLCR
jgi:ADP-ribosylation factor GTPase-activating protein 2/3